MSRTHHHHNRKSTTDLWSKRPCSQMTKCSDTKKMTIRVERNVNKQMIHNEVKSIL